MKNYDKLSQIIESFHNGQLSQARNQVDNYGQKNFIRDVIGNGLFSDFEKVNLINRLYVRG